MAKFNISYRQEQGDDGYQYVVRVNGAVRASGMTCVEAKHLRDYIVRGEDPARWQREREQAFARRLKREPLRAKRLRERAVEVIAAARRDGVDVGSGVDLLIDNMPFLSSTAEARVLLRAIGFPPNPLERPVLLHLCKDGTLTYRRAGEPVLNGTALPVFSVDTEAQAREAQVRFCRRQWVEHPSQPGRSWYRWTDFDGKLDSLERVTAQLQAWWEGRRS